MGHHREAHHSTGRDYVASIEADLKAKLLRMALKHAGKARWAFNGEYWLVNRMSDFPGGGQMLYGEPPAWVAEAIAMLRMVEANTEVPGLGFRYNDNIFYIDGALEKHDQTQ